MTHEPDPFGTYAAAMFLLVIIVFLVAHGG